MGFIDGLLGHYPRRRLTSQELIEKEQERHFALQVRNSLEEQQEEENLQEFLQRKSYLVDDKSRPNNLNDYIGQNDIKELIKISIEATKIKKSFLPHCLFYGEAGLGKTTLAYIIARELQANFILTNGEQFRSEKEVFSVLKKIEDTRLNILFIDECNLIKIPELFYPVMENFYFGYVTTTNKVINLPLPPFTLIGATTMPDKLPTPFLQRFQNRYCLMPYTVEDLTQIIRNYLTRINYYPTTDESLKEIALRSRNIARYVINYTRNLLDFCLVEHREFTPETVKSYFEKEGIDSEGLTKMDHLYLKVLLNAKNFKAGLATIIKATGINRRIIEQDIEPYLLRKEMIEIIPGGRSLRDKNLKEVKTD